MQHANNPSTDYVAYLYILQWPIVRMCACIRMEFSKNEYAFFVLWIPICDLLDELKPIYFASISSITSISFTKHCHCLVLDMAKQTALHMPSSQVSISTLIFMKDKNMNYGTQHSKNVLLRCVLRVTLHCTVTRIDRSSLVDWKCVGYRNSLWRAIRMVAKPLFP